MALPPVYTKQRKVASAMLYPRVFVAFNMMNTRQEGTILTATRSAPPLVGKVSRK